MFKRFKRNTAANRLIEEQLYEKAVLELESGQQRAGLWAKALADSEGDEQKSRGLYLRYRVQSMIDEVHVAEGIAEQLQDDKTRLPKHHEEVRNSNEPLYVDWAPVIAAVVGIPLFSVFALVFFPKDSVIVTTILGILEFMSVMLDHFGE